MCEGAPKLPYLGVDEIKNDVKGFMKALFAEFLGTALLVFIGCGSCMGGSAEDQQAQFVRIALCFGVTVATLAQTLGHVSGCHVNPAVTAGLVTGAKVGVLKGLAYVVAQSLGGLVGGGLLYAVVPEGVRGREGLGTTGIASNVSLGQAFGIEFLITMVLVLVVFGAAADEHNSPSVKGSAPLAIGLSITACHLFAIPLTGSSMNPARSLGSNAVNGAWKDLWVYWAGPLLGGVVAGLLYQLLLAAPAPRGTKEAYQPVEMKDKDQP